MKRINPKTNKPFKRWESKPDDPSMVFMGYRTTRIQQDGFFTEGWKLFEDVKHSFPKPKLPEIKEPKQRLNPITGKPFQRWEQDDKGRTFWRYREKAKKSDGYFQEDWRSPCDLPYIKPLPSKVVVDSPNRRLNPQTGEEFKRWDRGPGSRKIFWNYEDKKPIHEGDYCYELWRLPNDIPYPEPQEPEITYLKQCSICDDWKVRCEEFYKSNRSFDGRIAACKSCDGERKRNWQTQNPERFKELIDNRYQERKEEISHSFRVRYANDPEFRKQKLVDYYLREERTKRATPPWVRKQDLLLFYLDSRNKTEETGVQHHVDHIIPLQHELVCGLNIPANLQVITAEENLRKSNKFDLE
jgi:hypothetical protein